MSNIKKEYLPLVSFVIPTHNRANILRECLDSVVNQTYKNIEVVVVNDNSKDNTEEILKEYSRTYSFFRYYNNDGVGGNAARNFGIKIASGEYIAFMDDDDICELFRIEEQMKPVLESNFKYDFVVSSFYTFDSDRPKVKVIDFLKPLDSIGFTVRWLIKKDLIFKAGGFDIEQPALQDVEFFWRLKTISNIYFSPICVVKVRISKVSITAIHNNMSQGIKRLIKLHGGKMSKYEKNIWIINLCKNYAYEGDWKSYIESYNALYKLRVPFSSIVLISAFILKSQTILKMHSKIINKFFKYKGFYFKIRSRKL